MKKQVKKPIDYIPPIVEGNSGYYKDRLNQAKANADQKIVDDAAKEAPLTMHDYITRFIADGDIKKPAVNIGFNDFNVTIKDETPHPLDKYRGNRNFVTAPLYSEDLVFTQRSVKPQPAPNLTRKEVNEEGLTEQQALSLNNMRMQGASNVVINSLRASYSSINRSHNEKVDQYTKAAQKAMGDLDLDEIDDFKVAKPYPNYTNLVEEDVIKVDYEYRCIISTNKIHCNYIRFPKGFECTDEELISHAERGTHKHIQYIDYLPNQTPVYKDSRYKPLKANIPRQVVVEGIRPEDFALKTNQLFDKPTSLETYLNLTTAVTDYSRFRESVVREVDANGNIVGDNFTCLKNIFISDGLGNIGVTTGKVQIGQAILIEVISLDNYQNIKINSSFKISAFNLNTIRIVTNRNYMSKMFRFKIAGSKKSSEIFKQKTAKKKYEGKLYPAEHCRYYPGYRANSGDSHDIFIVYEEGKELIYLAEEVSVIGLNSVYLQKQAPKVIRSLEKGKQARVIDDKRLVNLSKGDVVTITGITTKPNKKSVATVTAQNGSKHTILLKQLKPYVNIEKISGQASFAAEGSTKPVTTIEEKDIVKKHHTIESSAANYKNSNFF